MIGILTIAIALLLLMVLAYRGLRHDQHLSNLGGGDNPLISLAIAVNLLAVMTGRPRAA